MWVHEMILKWSSFQLTLKKIHFTSLNSNRLLVVLFCFFACAKLCSRNFFLSVKNAERKEHAMCDIARSARRHGADNFFWSLNILFCVHVVHTTAKKAFYVLERTRTVQNIRKWKTHLQNVQNSRFSSSNMCKFLLHSSLLKVAYDLQCTPWLGRANFVRRWKPNNTTMENAMSVSFENTACQLNNYPLPPKAM